MGLDLCEGDGGLVLRQLHEGEQAHLGQIGLMAQTQAGHELAVAVVELLQDTQKTVEIYCNKKLQEKVQIQKLTITVF